MIVTCIDGRVRQCMAKSVAKCVDGKLTGFLGLAAATCPSVNPTTSSGRVHPAFVAAAIVRYG